MTGAGAPGVWPWAALLALGAAHGVNPGMGWLFAVALGTQHGERRAVWRALVPLAAGHAAAIAAAVALAAALGAALPAAYLRWAVAAALAALGVRQWRRHSHPRWGGMRVGARDLAVWSFLVATAHGAGLMAVPLAADVGALHAAHAGAQAHAHAHHAAAAVQTAGMAAGADDAQMLAVLATLVHTAGYLLATGLLAVLVYERLGLAVLRRAWVNLDRVWAAALVATALAVALA